MRSAVLNPAFEPRRNVPNRSALTPPLHFALTGNGQCAALRPDLGALGRDSNSDRQPRVATPLTAAHNCGMGRAGRRL